MIAEYSASEKYVSLYHNTFILLQLSVQAVIRMSETVEKEATSIKVNPELWKQAKIEAIKHNKTVSELVEEAIEQWIKERKKK